MTSQLKDYSISHGGLRRAFHPRLRTEVLGQTAIRYMRFMRQVRVDRLEMKPHVYGRWTPSVPTHPAHLIVSILNRETCRWEVVREVDFPADERILGKGLSQDMTMAEMEHHFALVMKDPPKVIELGGVQTDHLRIECDREHPVWPNHGEMNGGVFGVPFGILDPLVAYGQPSAEPLAKAPYNPVLTLGRISPAAPRGMRIEDRPNMVLFRGRRLAVGFSLRRPLIAHLGLDILGQGHADHNRVLFSQTMTRFGLADMALSGPNLRTLTMDCGGHLWTGRVSITGNRVTYRDLRGVDGLTVIAAFTIEPQGIILELTQDCAGDIPVLEAEAWRLTWDIAEGITGVAGMPMLLDGRSGAVKLPAILSTDGDGCLSCQVVQGDRAKTTLQVESYKFKKCVTSGFVLGSLPSADACLVIPKGRLSATLEMRVTNLQPELLPGAPKPPAGIRRHWATTFACFRPEYRGFSIHSASTDMHSASPFYELVPITKRPRVGPDPLELLRYTMERALLDGPGCGYHHNLYTDADPKLVCGAGRVFQFRPDLKWLKRIEPGLIESVQRMIDPIGEEGLLVSKDLSGNSGSHRWSTHELDTVGFGHICGLTNAWAYRAFRNAAAMLAELKQADLARRCRQCAARIKANYAEQLLNPATGWLGGWRSRDGKLHDYAFTYVNGPAIAFGLLQADAARTAMERLERLRYQVGAGSARMGIPFNLLPIDPADHMLPTLAPWGGSYPDQPTFEVYTDGALNGWSPTYYLRALSIYGRKQRARKLALELENGYACGIFNGGEGSGVEWRTWAGVPTGYEGTSFLCFGSLYPVAIELGLVAPPDPEWWPPGG